jgi:alcohol dehydrogenase class IV
MRVHVGSDQVASLAEILGAQSVEQALLVHGPRMGQQSALIKSVFDGAAGRIGSVFGEVAEHASMSSVDQATAVFTSNRCDGLVSLGGGSTHDLARAVALCVLSGRPIREHFQDAGRSYARVDGFVGTPPPIVAIPSTLSAAETSPGGGVVDETEHKKYVFNGDQLFIPDLILDPNVLATTPRGVVLSTGMNAVNHAMERICSPIHQPIADAGFTQALRMLLSGLPDFAADDHPRLALMERLLVGAHLSGSVNVRGGITHAICHVLGGQRGVPHGLANAIMLPGGIRFVLPVVGDRVALLARVISETTETMVKPDEVPGFVRDFVRRLGLPTRLRDVGIQRADLPAIARDVLADTSKRNSPRPVRGADEILGILEETW